MSTRYAVACIARNGVGPELMAQASRALAAVAPFHGFAVDDQHVPFGTDAFMRFGHPYPLSSRRRVLAADAVLVAPASGGTLEALEAELDVRASIARVRFDGRWELSVLAPLRDEAWAWTLARAFELARASRGRVTLVGVDERWASDADNAEAEHDYVEVERLSTADGVRALVQAPHRFDVVVCPPEVAPAAADVAACTAAGRSSAWGRLAGEGPSVFGTKSEQGPEVAGSGVVDPRPMLLAVSLLLGEGLRERAAAATLSVAVGRAHEWGRVPSTRGLADTVLAELPHGLGVEFQREAV